MAEEVATLDNIPDPFQLGDEDEEEDTGQLESEQVHVQEDEDESDDNPAEEEEEELELNDDTESAREEAGREDASPAPPTPVPKSPPLKPRPASFSLSLPALVAQNLFLPIPDIDPLTVLLAKHVPNPEDRPRRDVSGDYQRLGMDFNMLVMTNSWRALARFARDKIVACNPSDVQTLLQLWTVRITALAKLRLYNHAAAECAALFQALAANANPPVTSPTLPQQPDNVLKYLDDRLLIPIELELLRAKIRFWNNDQTGYLNDQVALLLKTRVRLKRVIKLWKNETLEEEKAEFAVDVQIVKDRLGRIAFMLASYLVERQQYHTAIDLLSPLASETTSTGLTGYPSYSVHTALAYINLQSGNLNAARTHLEVVKKLLASSEVSEKDVDPYLRRLNSTLRAVAHGEWDYAFGLLEDGLKEAMQGREGLDREDAERRVLFANNQSAVLLSQGRVAEAIQLLEESLAASPSIAVVAETFLFNLATLYELRAHTALEKKRALLIEVAKWSGDGLRPSALKLP